MSQMFYDVVSAAYMYLHPTPLHKATPPNPTYPEKVSSNDPPPRSFSPSFTCYFLMSTYHMSQLPGQTVCSLRMGTESHLPPSLRGQYPA